MRPVRLRSLHQPTQEVIINTTTNTGKRGRGRPSIASIVAPTLDTDGIAAYDFQGDSPVTQFRLDLIKTSVDRLRGRDHDVSLETVQGRPVAIISDDSVLA